MPPAGGTLHFEALPHCPTHYPTHGPHAPRIAQHRTQNALPLRCALPSLRAAPTRTLVSRRPATSRYYCPHRCPGGGEVPAPACPVVPGRQGARAPRRCAAARDCRGPLSRILALYSLICAGRLPLWCSGPIGCRGGRCAGASGAWVLCVCGRRVRPYAPFCAGRRGCCQGALLRAVLCIVCPVPCAVLYCARALRVLCNRASIHCVLRCVFHCVLRCVFFAASYIRTGRRHIVGSVV